MDENTIVYTITSSYFRQRINTHQFTNACVILGEHLWILCCFKCKSFFL